MGTMGWNCSPPLLAFLALLTLMWHLLQNILGNVLPSSTEVLEIPTRVCRSWECSEHEYTGLMCNLYQFQCVLEKNVRKFIFGYSNKCIVK